MPMALTATFEVTTPLFMAGAEQKVAEVRAASLKGLLRFWYRAINPAFQKQEHRLFGGAGDDQGQSKILLRVDSKTPKKRPTFKEFNPDQFSTGQGRNTRNGLIYLGYPFQMGANGSRGSIPPGHTFTLRCFLPKATEEDCKGLLAALWLLGHFGAGGSRARRGFGGLTLAQWEGDTSAPGGGGDWKELLDALPLAASASAREGAEAALNTGLHTLKAWFGEAWQADHTHPHLGPAFRFKLLDKGGVEKTQWAKGLAAMGSTMQDFRLRRAPDYQAVKDLVGQGRGLTTTPSRASFGLPLTFRFSSVQGKPATFVPGGSNGKEKERHGSLLLLRLLAVGETLYPLYIRMDGVVPGKCPPGKVRNAGRDLYPVEQNAMDEFFEQVGG